MLANIRPATTGAGQVPSAGAITLASLVDTRVPPTTAATSLFTHTDHPSAPPQGFSLEDIFLGEPWDSEEPDSLDSFDLD